MPIYDDSSIEPFYLKLARLEKECSLLTRTLGDKSTENDRLREALQTIAVEAGAPADGALVSIRGVALRALGSQL